MMDEEADRLLSPLRRPLVAALAVYVGDRAAAEDLAQEALARVLLDWPRVATKDNPRAWVYGSTCCGRGLESAVPPGRGL